MSKRIAIPSKEVQLKLVGPRDSLIIPRVQRLNFSGDKASTDIDELGNRLHAGTTVDTPAITATFQAFDVGIKLFSVLTGTDWTAFPGAGVSISNLGDADVVVHIKNASSEDFIKMAHARRCVVRDFTFTYNVGGESTEEYTVIGTQKRWFTNDVVVEKFVTGTTSFSLAETPVQLKNGNYALSAVLDGVYLDEVPSAPATGEYSVSGTTLTTADSRVNQLLVIYQAAPTGDNWADVSDTTMPAAIRGIDVPVVLSANNIERVQSVTINGTFNPETVREMGNRDIVGYQTQVPSVTGTISVLDTDTELIALFTTGSLLPADTEFGLSELTVSGISLDVKLVDPDDTTSPFTVLKTLYIPELEITSEAFVSNVNNNATQSFDFRSRDGDLIVYSGARV